jgi:two-component system, NtrC family, nitrogen regulation sensor histidine kinase NtrY
VSFRAKIILYLVGIHLIWAAMAVFVFFDNRVWLLAVELFFVISVIFGILLIRAFFVPLDLIRTGADLIRERDFTCKFIETGQPEMDQLISVYNRMIDALREERLKLTERDYFLHELVSASPSGIIILDFEGNVSDLNPAARRLLGQEASDIKGQPMVQLPEPFGSELEKLPAGEAKVISFHGNRRIKCQKSQFFDRGFARPFVVLEELTEELRVSEKRAYEKLIRMMSHEVSNSVGAIGSLLESCTTYAPQIRADDREDYTNALAVARDRAHSLNGFMRRFAEVVRLPAPEKRPCDLLRLLQDLASLYASELARRSICLRWDISEPCQPVQLDQNQMEQVFINVLKNAIEAIDCHGTITIRVGKNGGRFVTVEDSGPGIPAEIKESLFTPFFSTKADGQGIGLTLIQEILTQHGFRFSLESPPGGPTRFTIWI